MGSQKIKFTPNELNFLSEDWGGERSLSFFIQPPVSPPEDVIEANLPGEPVLIRVRDENPQTVRG